jgi:hypothetical protein
MNEHRQPTESAASNRRFGVFRFSMPEFLLSLALLLVAAPFLDKFQSGEMVEAVLMTLVLVSGVIAVGKNRRTLLIAAGLAVPAVAGKWLSRLRPEDRMTMELFLLMALLFMTFLLSQLFRFILVSPRVNAEVLCAGLAMYLLLGMTWSFAYELVNRAAPGAFALPAGNQMLGVTSLYFSFITLSTVGYGDITPVSNVARMLAAAEAITGTLFVAVFIARLVALYSTEAQQEKNLPSN